LICHLRRLSERVALLPGAAVRAFIDIDSLLPGPRTRQTRRELQTSKIEGQQILREGLSLLAIFVADTRTARLCRNLSRDDTAMPEGPVRCVPRHTDANLTYGRSVHAVRQHNGRSRKRTGHVVGVVDPGSKVRFSALIPKRMSA
jgi:hypothetical protein